MRGTVQRRTVDRGLLASCRPARVPFRLAFILFCTISVLWLSSADLRAADWYDSNWLYRQKITISPAVTDSDLGDFPYLVKIVDSTNPLFTHAQPDGDDILFTGADGTTKRDHEIEKYDNATDELFAWVRIPSLSSTLPTEIYVYYGYSEAEDQQNVAGVWDGDFVLVQHLQETSGTHVDSTTPGNNGTPNGGVDQTETGQIDGADGFDGSSGYVNVADDTGLQVMEMTLEAWVYIPGSLPSGFRGIVQHAHNTTNWYGLWKSGDADTFHFRWSTGTVRKTDFATTIVADRWYYVVGILDVPADKAFTYLDGNLDTTVDQPSPPTPTTGPVFIGAALSGPGEWFNGTIDEVRISSKARTQDWIEACYRNQYQPESYQTVGGQEPDPGPPADITDLATGTVGSSSVDLTWTAPGDDGSVGTATTYDVRYSTSPIDAGNWGSATQATGEPSPQAAGSSESFTVTGLDPGTPYYFAVKTADEVPNWSGLSNVVSATTTTEGSHIEGNVYEDPNGDSSLVDAFARQDVPVRLYEDADEDGIVDAGDTFLSEVLTDVDGFYSFDVDTETTGTTYVIAVDSRSVAPDAGFNGGSDQDDVWAEQTHGDDPSTVALDVGARFGGRTGGVSDAFDSSSTVPADNQYQHVARIDLGLGDALGVDFGFSFRVVTNMRGGDTSEDDDGSAARSIQGGFRQFLGNANAIAGADIMRFVPAVAANAGGGLWWQFAASDDLPDLLDTDTTIDGTCYSHTDGVTLRDENPGSLGSGGTVGTDALSLPTLVKPELEIVDANNRNIGLDVRAANTTIRRIAIYGFGDAEDNDGEGNIRVENVGGTLIEYCVIGASAGSFTSPGGPTADNVRLRTAAAGTIRYNLIGYGEGNGIGAKGAGSGWTIEGNEIRANGLVKAELNGISLETTPGATVRGNLIWENDGAGIDTKNGTGSHTIENNTIRGNGVGINGNAETPGIRLFGTGSTIDRNVLHENYGAGVMVTKAAVQNTIARNSIWDNGTILNNGSSGPTGQIGIDLLDGGDDDKTGDSPFYTINDSGDSDGDANGLLNFPVLDTAVGLGQDLTLTGWARPGSTIELFIAEQDASGFGEGKTYLLTRVEGSGDDQDSSSSGYGPGAVNGIAQGQDNTNRFTFVVSVPAGVEDGTVLTATATLSGATSEFSGVVTVSLTTPILGVVKSSVTVSDPVNGTTDPKAIPGSVTEYTVTTTNTGNGATDSDSVYVTEAVPANTALFVGDIGGAGSGPVAFEDGTTASGLNYTFTNLSSTTDDVEFSNNGGSTYAYTPVPDGDGFDAAVTHLRIKPEGAFAASDGVNHPSFIVEFRVRVQ